MSELNPLPEEVVATIERSVVAEFATVTAAGVPIDTPVYCFPSDDLATLDVATGLSYPAKAERARRNPKVGMLLSGGQDGHVVLVRGRAAVRDNDLQGNATRYLSESGYDAISFGLPWSEARKAVWYWTRMIIEVTPERVMWWDSADSMDEPPKTWSRLSAAAFPTSDPAPTGRTSTAPSWQTPPWRELAEGRADGSAVPHLTVCDVDGYPVPVQVRSWELTGEGFRMEVPRGVPWTGVGPATVTFFGLETFVGDVVTEGGVSSITIERALPRHPLVQNPIEVLQPSAEIKETLLHRLEQEVRRRGQAIPTIPREQPTLTRLAKVRSTNPMDRVSRISGGA